MPGFLEGASETLAQWKPNQERDRDSRPAAPPAPYNDTREGFRCRGIDHLFGLYAVSQEHMPGGRLRRLCGPWVHGPACRPHSPPGPRRTGSTRAQTPARLRGAHVHTRHTATRWHPAQRPCGGATTAARGKRSGRRPSPRTLAHHQLPGRGAVLHRGFATQQFEHVLQVDEVLLYGPARTASEAIKASARRGVARANTPGSCASLEPCTPSRACGRPVAVREAPVRRT